MSSQAVAWAIVHSAGGMSAKSVLMSIANFANEYGECWAAQDTIAEGAECSVRQLRRLLADLTERGLIERTRRGGAGKGRETDIIRLRMRELPAILSAKPREQPANLSGGQPDRLAGKEQPAKMADSGNQAPATGQSVRGATGQKRGGNRTIMSDNPNIPIPSSASCESDAALQARWFARLAAVAGPGLADPSKDVTGALHYHAGVFVAWARAGVDLEADAVPVIAAKTRRARASPVGSWKLFHDDVIAARDRRLASIPDPKPQTPNEEAQHGIRSDNLRPINAAEREIALTGARRASWARVIGRREGA